MPTLVAKRQDNEVRFTNSGQCRRRDLPLALSSRWLRSLQAAWIALGDEICAPTEPGEAQEGHSSDD